MLLILSSCSAVCNFRTGGKNFPSSTGELSPETGREAFLTTYLPTDSEKPPRRKRISGGAVYSCLCGPAPSLSCLKVRHGTLLWRILFYWHRPPPLQCLRRFCRRLLTHLIAKSAEPIEIFFRKSCSRRIDKLYCAIYNSSYI